MTTKDGHRAALSGVVHIITEPRRRARDRELGFALGPNLDVVAVSGHASAVSDEGRVGDRDVGAVWMLRVVIIQFNRATILTGAVVAKQAAGDDPCGPSLELHCASGTTRRFSSLVAIE